MHNLLHEFKRTIQLGRDLEAQVKEAIFVDELYSYLIYAKCDEFGSIENYYIKFMVAQDDSYNTINKTLAVSHVLDCIEMYKEYMGETKIIGYKQPPLEMMITLYEPLICTMALKMKRHWTHYEIDDLMQTCRICMCVLYDKGYYIHKHLLWTAFKNEILQEVRPLKNDITITSLYDRYTDGDIDDKDLCLIDTITDKVEEETLEDVRIREANIEIFTELKDIIIDLVGPRQFDMLFRDYSRGHTTPASRKLLTKVKTHLNSLGITRSQFNEKYHRKGN